MATDKPTVSFLATEVVPKLFLGTREDAEALGARVPDNWACISVTEYRSRYNRKEELPREPEGALDLPFMSDVGGWHADRHKLDLIAETIWWKLQYGKKVLVHCVRAQERSPLAVAWYLVWCGWSPSMPQAYEYVTRRHPRTELRNQWLRGEPTRLAPELPALLDAAHAWAEHKPPRKSADALDVLEAAARAWVSSSRAGSPQR